jgi:hypothetical protein
VTKREGEYPGACFCGWWCVCEVLCVVWAGPHP